MKKKMIALCFSLFVAVSLAGCGEKETTDMESVDKTDEASIDTADAENVDEKKSTDAVTDEIVDAPEEPKDTSADAKEVIFDYMSVLQEKPLNEIQVPGHKKGLPMSLNTYMPSEEYISEDWKKQTSMGMYHYGVTYDEEYETNLDTLFIGFGTLSATLFNETFEEDIVERYGNYFIVTDTGSRDYSYAEYIYILEDGMEDGVYITYRSDFEEEYDVVKAIASKNLEYIKEQINNL